MTVILGNPGSGAGRTDLQQAYDNSPTPGAQILLDTVPNPVTVEAAVAGEVFSLLDTAGTKIFEVDSDPDFLIARTGVTIEDAFTNGGASSYLTFADTFTTGGGYLGGCILSNGTITYDNSFFIWALLQESKTYNAAASPGFAAFTLFNALAVIQNLGNFDLVQALILNNGLVHSRITSGTSTVTQTVGLSNSPQSRTTVSGAVLTKTTGDTAVRHSPTFSTVAGSTVNIGTQRGLHCLSPAAALFQPSAGVENMTAYIGVDQEALPFGGNVTKRALRSALTAATNTLMIENTGGAASDFGAGGLHFDDSTPLQLGGTAFNSQDFSMLWNPAGHVQMFFSSSSDSLELSSPSADRFLLTTNGGNTVSEYNFDCSRFSLGAQTGAVGNQVGVFVTGARSTSVGGEWSDFLLTQGGNLTVNAAMGLVAGWTVNAPSITLGTGTVSEACALNVGGNVNQGTAGRYGLRIISNPSGATDNYPLYVVNGTSRINGLIAGDPGTEAGSIDIGGVAYDSALKVSALGGTDQAQFIMHRHNTGLGPVIVGARSNTNDDSHSIVLDDQDLLALVGTGWDGTDYEMGAVITMSVDGTPGNDDMPGRIDLLTTPDASNTPLLALRINSSQRCDFQTNQALGGGAAATLGTIGGSGPTAAAQAQWLEIEIGGTIHWIPVWT